MARNTDKYYALSSEAMRSLARFVLGVVVARWAGPEIFGTFVIMVTVEVVVHTICNSLWATPMASLAPGLPEPGRSRMMHEALRRHWRGSAVAALLSLGIAPYILANGMEVSHVIAFTLAVFFTGGLNGTRARVAGAFQSKAGLLSDSWATLLPVGAVVWAQLAGGDVILVYLLSRAASAALSAWRLHVKVPLRHAAGAIDMGPFQRMGKHMAVGSVANSVCTRVQPFVLASAASAIELGMFGAASALVGPLRMATAAMSGVLRPRLALHFGGGKVSRGWKTALAALGLASIGGMIFCLGALVAGQWVGRLAYGSSFEGIGLLLVWAALHASLGSINALLVVVIQIVDSAATTAKMRISVGVLAIATVGPFVVQWGARGAFGSLILAEAVYSLVGAVVLVRVSRAKSGHDHTSASVESDAPAPQRSAA